MVHSPGAATQITRNPLAGIIALSTLIAAFLVWLVYFKGAIAAPSWVALLPASNALFNGLSAICLTLGYANIRRGNRAVHKRFMLSATSFSSLFLVGYITYHYFHGDSRFLAHGWIRPVYFTILISHIGLSIVALPLILGTLWYALNSRFAPHRRIARWAFPVWLYISVTGVLVFFILRTYSS
jgi:putative membrane protein